MRCNHRPTVLAALGILFMVMNAVAAAPPAELATKPLQFTSGGHILGFTSKDVVVATGSHALRVEFVGAKRASPMADRSGAAADGKAPPLGRVSYQNLWDGITLSYETGHGGIYRSTYSLAAGADPGQIRLRYNTPVTIQPGGELRVASGWLNESAPVAWQEAAGKRVPVQVTFRTISDREIGFALGPYDRSQTLWIDPTLTWNTFLGSSGNDNGSGIALDGSGNVYVTGHSAASWGSPLITIPGIISGVYVAKLNGYGVLQWHTFLGSVMDSSGITVDGSGNVYVTGCSGSTWGSPIRAFSGVFNANAFVAKLNTSGALQWNTFFGNVSANHHYGRRIAVDGGGNVYVTGDSGFTWGSPIRAFSGGNYDVFTAKLNSAGALQWNTFLGSSGIDHSQGIAVDGNGNVYIAGNSPATWGSPVSAFSGLPGTEEGFVAKLSNAGTLQWNTFLGGSGAGGCPGIAVDWSGNVYAAGQSRATWGSPIRAFSGYSNAFVAKLNTAGALLWNTFLGSS